MPDQGFSGKVQAVITQTLTRQRLHPDSTHAVVEGLEGKGGIAALRQVSTKELADYVIKRVEELAKARSRNGTPDEHESA